MLLFFFDVLVNIVLNIDGELCPLFVGWVIAGFEVFVVIGFWAILVCSITNSQKDLFILVCI